MLPMLLRYLVAIIVPVICTKWSNIVADFNRFLSYRIVQQQQELGQPLQAFKHHIYLYAKPKMLTKHTRLSIAVQNVSRDLASIGLDFASLSYNYNNNSSGLLHIGSYCTSVQLLSTGWAANVVDSLLCLYSKPSPPSHTAPCATCISFLLPRASKHIISFRLKKVLGLCSTSFL